MSAGSVAVGVIMAAFLVWLWRYSPEAEDEVLLWLNERGLANMRRLNPIREMKSLEELASLDVASLPEILLTSPSLSTLHQAVLQLDLQLWLREEGIENVFPQLVQLGHTSKHSLLALDPAAVIQLADLLSPVESGKKFQDLLSTRGPSVVATAPPEPLFTIGSLLKYGFYLLVVTLLLAAGALAVVYIVGTVLLEALVVVIVYLIYAIVSAFLRRRVTPPPVPAHIRLQPTLPGFLVFVGRTMSAAVLVMRDNVRSWFQSPRIARVMRVPAREVPEPRLGLVERIQGQYLDPKQCRLEWNHKDSAEVGGASVATLHLVCENSTPYELQSCDTLRVTVKHVATGTVVPHVVEPAPPTTHSKLRLSFTTRLAGEYSMVVQIKGRMVAGAPFTRTYLPGPVDPSKTTFINQPHWLVLTAGYYYSMMVAPRDAFGNSANIIQDHLTVCIRKDGPEGRLVNPECVVERVNSSRFELLLKVENTGHYVGSVLYKDQTIGPPQFTIVSLSVKDDAAVDKNLHQKSLYVYYEASLMTDASGAKWKKVYCYLYPKQLQVKEFFLKLIPYRHYICRVCPSTNIRLHAEAGLFTVDDGYQPPVTLSSRHREVIAATFFKHVLKNIGGSEQFKDKEKYFFTELSNHHSKHHRSEINLRIDRINLLNSAMQATKGFSTSDWCKSFVVKFKGEEALDWGGVSRELFQLLCTHCFNCANGMFQRFKDDPQALVHPNHKHPASISLRHYEFAGRVVGKCLYESALGNRLLVSARFSRSFLAQMIGLRINYKYFETDDPELYTSKIQYIRDHDVTDLELVFAEEEFCDDGTVHVVPLTDHGVELKVTQVNKSKYLTLLAQHRLANQSRAETEHFLKGLNDLVPDNLLGIFDENELELLMCGTETVSYEDLKKHAVVSMSINPSFQKVVSWFWIVVSNFTQEEMARLLQFVTGCSQLPPGGFKELNPKFQITSAPTHGHLPSAHTCFNQLCLPEYDSCEQFQPALMMALNEGAEGFGLV